MNTTTKQSDVQQMRLFRVDTTLTELGSKYVDWYEVETLEQAQAQYAKDVVAYGLPAHHVTFTEYNPNTLKPLCAF